MNEFLTNILNDLERSKLELVANDPIMKEALRKLFLDILYRAGSLREGLPSEPGKNGVLALAFQTLAGKAVITNEQLGEDLRAMAHGINVIESGFKDLERFKKADEIKKEVNEAI